MKRPHDRGLPLVPPKKNIEYRLDMSQKALLDQARAALTDVRAEELARHIAHPKDDVGITWTAEDTAIVNISLWQAMEPPFAHAVIVLTVLFDAGVVIDISDVKRISFGA